MSDQTCHYCGEGFEPYELRPYGPGGALVCFPCATATPEREEQAKGRFGALLDANEQVSPTGSVTIDSRTSDGPRPSTPDELSASKQPAGDTDASTEPCGACGGAGEVTDCGSPIPCPTCDWKPVECDRCGGTGNQPLEASDE